MVDQLRSVHRELERDPPTQRGADDGRRLGDQRRCVSNVRVGARFEGSVAEAAEIGGDDAEPRRLERGVLGLPHRAIGDAGVDHQRGGHVPPVRSPRLTVSATVVSDQISIVSHHDEGVQFGPWLAGLLNALEGARDADVPCNGCTACCTSAQFVHVGPDEHDALAHIPAELLVPAPGLPEGNVVLGYDERGRCPMLGDAGCTIYAHRPRTCRTYDCRVFPAAGLSPAEPDQAAIAERAARWRFRLPTVDDERRSAAVRSAAGFLAERRDTLPRALAPTTTTQHAVLAVALHALFLGSGAPTVDELAAHVGRPPEDLVAPSATDTSAGA